MKVLVLGGGGREHALVWKLSQSRKIDRIYAAPGNAGTAQIATNFNIPATDKNRLAEIVKKERIDLIVVGPEDPLAEGAADYFQNIGVSIFGPRHAAAQLESSKAFSKELFQKYAIPSANSQTFSDLNQARDYIMGQGAPLVIKADGLAAGKGVIMAETTDQALKAVSVMMKDRVFGAAGSKVIIEEKLHGKEMSFFAITDGTHILPMVPACDYKRIGEGDQGLNTGGMGGYSPPYFYTADLGKKILNDIIDPTVKAMAVENRKYEGVLYAGLMVDSNQPKILEYNVRFGDPECQVIMPRLKSDLLDIIMGVVNNNLETVKPEWSNDVSVGVVLASGGYPQKYRTGLPITGLDKLDKDIVIFHAGTKPGEKGGEILTSGGRVLTLVATAPSIAEAREKIYANISKIHFENCYFRKDIALF